MHAPTPAHLLSSDQLVEMLRPIVPVGAHNARRLAQNDLARFFVCPRLAHCKTLFGQFLWLLGIGNRALVSTSSCFAICIWHEYLMCQAVELMKASSC